MRISTTGRGSAPRDGAIANCCRTSAATSAIPAARANITAASANSKCRTFATTIVASKAWVDAGVEFGLPRNPDFNGETTFGVGSYQLGIGRHWRTSSASAFLRPAAHRPNLTVITGAQVSKVAFQGPSRPASSGSRTAQAFSAAADREVILSAGALQSPQILQLSGVGPADLLRGFGIPVVADSPEVGRNLQDHYQARLIVRLKQRISLNDQVRNPVELAKMGLQWMFAGSGPLTVGAGQVGGAACTEYAVGGRPDVQFNVMPLSVDKPGDPLHSYSGFTASVWQCHGKSRGNLAIRSTDPFDQPRIEPNYFAEDIDRKTMVAGLQMLREIYRQKSFRDLWDIEMVPGEAVDSVGRAVGFRANHRRHGVSLRRHLPDGKR